MKRKATHKTQVLSKICLILIGVFVALLISEVSLRSLKWMFVKTQNAVEHNGNEIPKNDAYEKDGEHREKHDRFALMRFSSFLGYYPFENHRGEGYVSNQYGFRYKEDFPIKKPRGEIRIFVTGGSTAWGTGVSQEDMFTNLAERYLQINFPRSKIRVISAGVGAYLSTHERILVINKIIGLDPDVVIMFSGWNDTFAGYRGFRVIDDTWDYLGAAPILAKNSPRYSHKNQKKVDEFNKPQYDDYIIKTHYILDMFFYGLRSRKEIEQSISHIQIEPEINLYDLKNNIDIVVYLSKRNKFSFIFYLQPSLYNSNKELSPFESYLTKQGETQYIGYSHYNSQLYDLYRENLPLFAKREGFVFVDGDDAISNEKGTVFDDHVHFGDRGNDLIAKHLAEVITGLLTGKSDLPAEHTYDPSLCQDVQSSL